MVTSLSRFITTLAACASMVVMLTAAPVNAATTCKAVNLSAHRGESNDRYTENSYRSLLRAAKNGADSVEFDVRVTKDGKWVLMHDGTVDRTTNGTGKVEFMTLADIRALKLDDSAVTGVTHRVPLMSTVIAGLRTSQPALGFQVEFKPQNITDEELIGAVSYITSKVPYDQLLITSLDNAILQRIRALDANIETGYIVATGASARVSLQSLIDTNNDYVMLDYRAVDKSFVDRAHAKGLKVNLRSASTPKQWSEALSKNADRLVIDNTSSYVKWCNAR